MFESPIRENGNIHKSDIKGTLPKAELYRPGEQYEKLKNTVLYDKRKEQWNSCMAGSEGPLTDTNRHTCDQLLGILVEKQFDFKNAEQRFYKNLMRHPFYNTEYEMWNSHVTKEQKLECSDFYAHNQLLGVLVEVQFNPEIAYMRYEDLKGSPLHDKSHEQWNWCMRKDGKWVDSTRYAHFQLLGVLAEAQFDLDAARNMYETLKHHTPLYDAERGQWRCCMNERQVLRREEERVATAHLFAVLVEAHLDPASARGSYEALKLTNLYDTVNKQWNYSISENQQLESSNRYARNQLLGILVETMLINSLCLTRPPLPPGAA